MRFPALLSVSALVAFSATGSWVSVAASGQASTPQAKAAPKAAAKTPASSRTPWGHPDLQGTWVNVDLGVPYERPPEFGNRPFLTEEEFATRMRARAANRDGIAGQRDGTIYFPSNDKAKLEQQERSSRDGTGAGPEHWYEWFGRESRRTSVIIDPPDGKMPAFTPEGQKIRTRRSSGERVYDGPEDFGLWDRCITRGLPNSMVPTVYNNAYRIFQAPGYVVIFYELFSKARIIPLDGRPHLPPAVEQWDGDARGRWDGNTLVVDVTNFSDQTKGTLQHGPFPAGFEGTGKTLHLVERFTRIDPTTIRYEATIDDRVMYTKPWTIAQDLGKDESYQFYEYACHEGNYAVPNALSGARARDRSEADAAKKK